MSLLSAVQSTSARAASLKALIDSSVRRTSGCTMIGSAGLSGAFGAGERAALQAVLRVGGRVLVGDLGLGEALDADREPRLVHHHEHGVEAAIRLADEPARRAVIVHDAGRVAVDAHLVLDRAAGRRRCARRACRRRSTRNFGTTKSEMPLVPAGAPSMRASTRWTMFSARSCSPAEMKILVPVDRVGAVAVRHGLGLEQAEIGAAMRLGEVHGAGPGALDHLRQIGALLLLGAVHEQRGDRALGQARIHAEAPGCAEETNSCMTVLRVMRQALAAIFRRRRQAHPAAVGDRPRRLP